MSNRVQALSRLTRSLDQDGGGSFLSANITRVDPSGNDSTGVVGVLTQPFLTVQAAVDALTPGGFYAIDIGTNVFNEDVVTDFYGDLFIIGIGEFHAQVQSLTFTGTQNIDVYLIGASVGSITANNLPNTSAVLIVFMSNAAVTGTVASTDGAVEIIGDLGPFNDAQYDNSSQIDEIDAALVILRNCYVNILTCTGEAYAYYSQIKNATVTTNLHLNDSRVTDSSSVGGATSYSDKILSKFFPGGTTGQALVKGSDDDFDYEFRFPDPATMDFSSLPTSIPSEVGKAWIDTTGGLNIVKVKL